MILVQTYQEQYRSISDNYLSSFSVQLSLEDLPEKYLKPICNAPTTLLNLIEKFSPSIIDKENFCKSLGWEYSPDSWVHLGIPAIRFVDLEVCDIGGNPKASIRYFCAGNWVTAKEAAEIIKSKSIHYFSDREI